MKIGKIYTFEAAHYLPGHPKCGNLHGHSYKVEVVIRGPINENGMVIDFGDLDIIVDPIIRRLDHTKLNSIPGLEVPTAENICIYIVGILEDGLKENWESLGVNVKVWETAKCWAEL